MDPEYGSGSNIAGLGMVFILGIAVLALGVVVMFYMRWRYPAFFQGPPCAEPNSPMHARTS